MNQENELNSEEPNKKPIKHGIPSLLRNYVSFIGTAIVAASLASVTLLFLIEITSETENPYIGILTYIILPSIMIFGLVVMALGAILERRRRRRGDPEGITAYPKLDLNDAYTRRSFVKFLVITFFFVTASAFGSYRAFEYTESVPFCGVTCHTVMKPEYTAYLAGAHARVACVQCHVGSGAGWYARSKLSGAYQLYSVSFNKYSRPITSPVHNLRPAPETCEQCHWPEKFFGAQMKVFNHYKDDEKNTLHQSRMLINVGGTSGGTGQATGIHWHVDPANEVSYITTDKQRQVIPWVQMKDRDGKITEFFDRSQPLTAEQKATMATRKMDCVDCHNRPAHQYVPPDVAVDQSFASGALDQTIPFLKQKAVEVLTGTYETTPEALNAIDVGLNDFYRTNYPDLYSGQQPAIQTAVKEIQRVFQTYFFPEMKTNWQTHPNNIGHKNFPGCFRCHDGQHVSNTGKVITNDCNVCHTSIFDSTAPPAANMQTGAFQHPVDLGALADRKCNSCHTPDKPFKHPVNLGDISRFQCAVCHPRK